MERKRYLHEPSSSSAELQRERLLKIAHEFMELHEWQIEPIEQLCRGTGLLVTKSQNYLEKLEHRKSFGRYKAAIFDFIHCAVRDGKVKIKDNKYLVEATLDDLFMHYLELFPDRHGMSDVPVSDELIRKSLKVGLPELFAELRKPPLYLGYFLDSKSSLYNIVLFSNRVGSELI